MRGRKPPGDFCLQKGIEFRLFNPFPLSGRQSIKCSLPEFLRRNLHTDPAWPRFQNPDAWQSNNGISASDVQRKINEDRSSSPDVGWYFVTASLSNGRNRGRNCRSVVSAETVTAGTAVLQVGGVGKVANFSHAR